MSAVETKIEEAVAAVPETAPADGEVKKQKKPKPNNKKLRQGRFLGLGLRCDSFIYFMGLLLYKIEVVFISFFFFVCV